MKTAICIVGNLMGEVQYKRAYYMGDMTGRFSGLMLIWNVGV
jgi:hypothetical protein